MKPIHDDELLDIGGPCGGRIVASSDGRIVADEVDGDASVLLRSAPDMARALLGLLSLYDVGLAGSHDNVGWDKARAALRKAGVIPTQLPPASSDNQS